MRTLLRTPWLLVSCVLPLGVGIAGCAISFALVFEAYLAPLPFRQPDRLIEIWSSPDARSRVRSDLLPSQRIRSLLDDVPKALVDVAGYGLVSVRTERDDRRELAVAIVTAGYFRLLGSKPLLGALELDQQSQEVVISESLWRRRFAATPDIVGRTVSFAGQVYIVSGVLSGGEEYPAGIDLWIPANALAARFHPAGWVAVGRMFERATIESLQDELSARALRSGSTEDGTMGLAAAPLARIYRDPVRAGIPLLAGATALVYAAILANLAHLALVRMLGRRREMAVRNALGGGSWALVRPVLAEATLITLLALALGGAVTPVGLALLHHIDPDMPAASFDWRLMVFVGGLALATAVILSFVPLSIVNADVRGILRPLLAHRGRRDRFTSGVMVAAQVAIAVMLLGIVGVLLKAVGNVRALDVGYDAGRVVLVRPDWASTDAGDATQRYALEGLQQRLPSLATAEAVALWRTRVGAWPPPPPDRQLTIDNPGVEITAYNTLWNFDEVTPSYFRTIGLNVIEGRTFMATDMPGTLPVAIVSESAARAWWPESSAIGRRLRLGDAASGEPWLTVVGVARDAEPLTVLSRAIATIGRPSRRVYRPLAQSSDEPAPAWRWRKCFYCSSMTMAVRPRGDARAFATQLERELTQIAPDLPHVAVATAIDEQMSYHGPADYVRSARVLGVFGSAALLIALLGIGTIVADAVVRLRREIGIRLALGAPPLRLVTLVMRDSILVSLSGAAGGVALLLAASPLIRQWVFLGGGPTLLVGTGVIDWLVLSKACALSLIVSAACGGGVGYRATHIDPMLVMKDE